MQKRLKKNQKKNKMLLATTVPFDVWGILHTSKRGRVGQNNEINLFVCPSYRQLTAIKTLSYIHREAFKDLPNLKYLQVYYFYLFWL